MAIAVEGTPTTRFNANSSTYTCDIDPLTVLNELIVVQIRVNSGGGTLTNQQGFDLLHTKNDAGTNFVLAKIATASEPSTYAFTGSLAGVNALSAIRLSGVDLTDFMDVVASDGGSSLASLVVPAVTTTGANKFIIRFGAANAATTFTWSRGTEIYDASGTNRTISAIRETQAVAGDSGTATLTPAVTANLAGITMAFNEAVTTVDGPLAPNLEISRLNLTGPLSYLQDDPLSPDANFLTGPRSN